MSCSPPTSRAVGVPPYMSRSLPRKLITSEPILSEFEQALLLKARVPHAEAAAARRQVQGNPEVCQPVVLSAPVCRDADDDAILGTAIAAKADLIVSGDKDLLVLDSSPPARVDPAAGRPHAFSTPSSPPSAFWKEPPRVHGPPTPPSGKRNFRILHWRPQPRRLLANAFGVTLARRRLVQRWLGKGGSQDCTARRENSSTRVCPPPPSSAFPPRFLPPTSDFLLFV